MNDTNDRQPHSPQGLSDDISSPRSEFMKYMDILPKSAGIASMLRTWSGMDSPIEAIQLGGMRSFSKVSMLYDGWASQVFDAMPAFVLKHIAFDPSLLAIEVEMEQKKSNPNHRRVVVGGTMETAGVAEVLRNPEISFAYLDGPDDPASTRDFLSWMLPAFASNSEKSQRPYVFLMDDLARKYSNVNTIPLGGSMGRDYEGLRVKCTVKVQTSCHSFKIPIDTYIGVFDRNSLRRRNILSAYYTSFKTLERSCSDLFIL